MEWLLFCQQFIKNPGYVGSILPSSRFLARKLVSNINWHCCNTIVELGAGTGSFTKYLLRHKPPGSRLLVFEKDHVFRMQLAKKFRNISLYTDAASLKNVLLAEGINGVDCIVSGLPFAVLPNEEKQNIFNQIRQVLPSGAQFITFQYSPQIYRELCRNFSEVQIDGTFLNVPPAIIYVCKR